jgi:uncharacterized membrane protein
MKAFKFDRLATLLITSLTFASVLEVRPLLNDRGFQVSMDREAWAARSGGRSGGGSFRSNPSRSSGGSSGGSSGNSPTYTRPANPAPVRPPDRDRYYDPGYNRGPVIVPVPIPGGGYAPNPYQGNPNFNNPYPAQTAPDGSTIPQGVPSASPSPQPADKPPSGMDVFLGLLLLAVGTILPVGAVIWLIKRFSKRKGKGGGDAIANDVVTVSQVQVALLAEARAIQSELTELSLQVDTTTSEGLLQLLQETALALLRSPENWSHVLASSQTVNTREEAEGLFNQVAIGERSKYTAETLTNVGGRVNQSKNYQVDPDKAPAAYIVVTLVVGSVHDQPLFTEVRTTEQLRTVLQTLASMPADHLLVFELLWTPQAESDSLTYDELLMDYAAMVQI